MMKYLISTLFLCVQIKGFVLNSNTSPVGELIVGTKGYDAPHHQSRRKFPESSSIPQLKTSFANQKRSIELRAGALAIHGLDPINLFFSQYPFAAAFMVCATKASAADAVAQKKARMSVLEEEEKAPFNRRRNFAFLLYGGAYQGMFQELLYNTAFPLLFGEGGGAIMAVRKVSFDMLVITPFLCLPVVYIIKAVVFEQTFSQGVGLYINDVKNNKLLFKYWAVWIPVQSMTFTIVPIQYRITFIAAFSFFWLILLSTISSKTNVKTE